MKIIEFLRCGYFYLKISDMKILLSTVLIVVFAFNSFSSPLIFTASKEVKEKDFVELATIDTAKYKQIRIAVDATTNENINENVATDKKFSVQIYAVENGKEIFLDGKVSNGVQFRAVLDTPPTKIKIKVRGETTYTAYVWATQ